MSSLWKRWQTTVNKKYMSFFLCHWLHKEDITTHLTTLLRGRQHDDRGSIGTTFILSFSDDYGKRHGNDTTA